MSAKPSNNLNELNGEFNPSKDKVGLSPAFSQEIWANPGTGIYRTGLSAINDQPLLAFERSVERSPLIADDHLHEMIAQSFYMQAPLNGQVKAADLIDAGVIDGSLAINHGDRRSPSSVKHIVIKELSKEPHADLNAVNYLISDKHIAISQRQHPDLLPTHKNREHARASNEITIYLDDVGNGAPGSHHELTERQKASLRLLLHWEQSRYRKSTMVEGLPIDVLKALNEEVTISVDAERKSTDRFNPHPFPWWQKNWWSNNDDSTDDTCGKLADTPTKDTPEYDQFVDKLIQVLSVNEGNKTALTRNDHGSGISVGEAQWNQKKGELPNLLQAWLDKDPEFFKSTFAPYLKQMLISDKKINEDNIRSMNMGGDNDFCNQMQKALNYLPYQYVQDALVRAKAEKAITVADKYGHHSQRFVAEVLDVANEKGWGGCEARMRKANVAGIPEEEECTAIKAFEQNARDRAGWQRRDKNLDKMFAPDRTAYE